MLVFSRSSATVNFGGIDGGRSENVGALKPKKWGHREIIGQDMQSGETTGKAL